MLFKRDLLTANEIVSTTSSVCNEVTPCLFRVPQSDELTVSVNNWTSTPSSRDDKSGSSRFPTVQLTCTVTFGGPQFSSEPKSNFPQLQLSIVSSPQSSEESKKIDVASADAIYEPGKPGTERHRLTKVRNEY